MSIFGLGDKHVFSAMHRPYNKYIDDNKNRFVTKELKHCPVTRWSMSRDLNNSTETVNICFFNISRLKSKYLAPRRSHFELRRLVSIDCGLGLTRGAKNILVLC